MLEFIYQDTALIVIKKPSGLHSVSNKNSVQASLADQLLAWDRKQAEVAPKSGDAGLVQRLDFETQGLILAAKKQEIWQALHQAILCGQIKKTYLALVEGKARHKTEIENYLGANSRSANKVKIFKRPRAKDRALPAKSVFELLKYYQELDCSLVRVLAPTARRHQVRAHAQAIGHCLVGDKLYGSNRKICEIEAINPRLRQTINFYLLAESLEFFHPTSKEKLRFSLEF